MTKVTDNLTALFKTVDIFAALVQKPLRLRNGKIPRTELNNIFVPLKDPDAYLLLERQLAHILFQSDSASRDRFVRAFLAVTEQTAKTVQIQVDPLLLRRAMEQIIDILESHRIESLWGLIYAGSFQRMREYLQKTAAALLPRAHDSFADYMVCLDAQLPIPAGMLDSYKDIFLEALAGVEHRGFAATLIMARTLVLKLVDLLLQEEGRSGVPGTVRYLKDRAMALVSVLHQFNALPKQVEEHYNDYTLQDAEPSDKAPLALDLRDSVAVSAALSDSEIQMTRILATVQASAAPKTHDDWLRQTCAAQITFVDIHRADVLVGGGDIYAEDAATIRRLRQLFQRVIGRQVQKLDSQGVEVDVPAYIERRLSKQTMPCFKAPASGRGFKALILLDRSLSMAPETDKPLTDKARIRKAERAALVLKYALAYPFVDMRVWGFQSPEDGEVLITRYATDVPSFTTLKVPVRGDTPLHVAIQAAIRELSAGSEVKQLFVLTDGAPSYVNQQHYEVPKGQLHLMIHEAVRQARRTGINVSALLIGDRSIRGKIAFEVKPAELLFMFGAERFWRCIDEERLGSDLINVVSQSFVNYLSRN